jgi:hypothetical protein
MACEEGWKLEAEVNIAVNERVNAENELGIPQSGETFGDRWERFRIAVDRWQHSLHNRYLHIADCPKCFPNPPR